LVKPPVQNDPDDQQSARIPLVLDVHLRGLHYDRKPILGAINLSVMRGQTLAILGPSGVGKTSLLRVIAGLEDRADGVCKLTGRVAMVFQEPTLLPWRSLRENLCVTTGISADQAHAALDQVGLSGRADDFPAQLSLGQQRRLSLARAFAVKPSLLLMDEPFVSLDPDLVEEMMDLFMDLRTANDVATIFVTHVEAEATRLADRTLRMEGTPGQITSDWINAG
jgi:NitT/TauT family transport system ATP-binding protein